MNRLLLCAVLALGLAACGGRDAGDRSSGETAAPATVAAQPEAAPDSAAAPPAAEPAAGAEHEDGESVDDVTASVSPIAAAVAASTPGAPAPLPARWKINQHYAPLPVAQPVSVPPGEIEVTEIFSYHCGACFSLEPRLEAWQKGGKPPYVRVVRLQAVWGDEVSREYARILYTLQTLGKLDTLHLAVFRELHVNRKTLIVTSGSRVDTAATEQRVREFLLANGVTAEEFGKTYRSFAVESKIRQAEALSRRYMADHTPMFVVQGKYLTDVSMAGGVEQLFQLIGDLAARERASR